MSRLPRFPRRRRSRNRGQALPILVVAMVALIGMTGLIVDGGTAWANSRGVQIGADAAAEAGAVVLSRRLAGAIEPSGGWDAQVRAAIDASAQANGISVTGAYYTDICGIPLTSSGTASLYADGTYNFETAKPVGSGLPVPTATTPDCPSRTVGPVAGVIVIGNRNVGTYFSGVFGLRTIPVTMQATAAAGFLQESCAASQGEACGMLPVAFPVNETQCTDQGNGIQDLGTPWQADGRHVYIVPLCENGPGNVGYIDWTPPSGGTQELIDSITHPNNPAVSLPSWQWIAGTGNTNSSTLQTAMRAWDGHTVLVPQFDLTCNPGPGSSPTSTSPAINTYPNYGCPAGDLGGNGTNQWYRIPSFAHFRLCHQDIPACANAGANHGTYISGATGNDICSRVNAKSCLVGIFQSVVRTGTIGAGFGGGVGNSKAVGIQLIK